MVASIDLRVAVVGTRSVYLLGPDEVSIAVELRDEGIEAMICGAVGVERESLPCSGLGPPICLAKTKSPLLSSLTPKIS